MAAPSFSSLKDLLNAPQSPVRRTPMTRSPSLTSLEVQSNFSNLSDESFLSDYLGGLSIQRSPTSSSLGSLDVVSVSSFSSSYQSTICLSPKSECKNDDDDDEGNKDEKKESINDDVKAELSSYVKHDKCAYTVGSPGKAVKLYPPPISSLKLSKTGKPCVYYRYDEADGSFVQEEMRIPKRDTFCAARANGSLKLCFDYSDDDDESCEVEEEVEEEEDVEWERIDKAYQ